MRPVTEDTIERVRAICRALPKVVEHVGVASGVGARSRPDRAKLRSLGADTDWTEIAELVTDSFLLMAPKQLAAEVEAALHEGGA